MEFVIMRWKESESLIRYEKQRILQRGLSSGWEVVENWV